MRDVYFSTLTRQTSRRFGERFGFVKTDASTLSDYIYHWRTNIQGRHSRTIVSQNMYAVAPTLRAPVSTWDIDQFMVVSTQNPEWVAYFDNSVRGGDPSATLELAARDLNTQAVLVGARPFVSDNSNDPLGAYQFWYMLGGGDEARTIDLIQESAGPHYHFEEQGPLQDWELPEQYRSVNLNERFDLELLEKYCKALGLDVYDTGFYAGPCVIIGRQPQAQSFLSKRLKRQ